MRLISNALLCGLLLLPTALLAQADDWKGTAESLLAEERDRLAEGAEPLKQVGESSIGLLGEDESAVGKVEDLDDQETGIPGPDYVLVAVCDADCSDIDLYLYDQAGTEVATDVNEGTPATIVTDQLESGYTIEVYMAECAVAPCYYGLALYKGTAAAQQTE